MPGEDESGLESQNLEAQKAQLVDETARLNESLGSKFVTNFSLDSGGALQIFNAQPVENEVQPHSKIAAAGIHPNEGPIIITTGALGEKIRGYLIRNIRGEKLTGNWNTILKEVSDERKPGSTPIGEMRGISPEEQNTWTRTMSAAKENAQRRIESERMQHAVVPASLAAVIEAAK